MSILSREVAIGRPAGMGAVANPDVDAPLAQAAVIGLEFAARQFCTVRQQVQAGADSQELLGAACAHLERAALTLATAHGWRPPPI